MALSLSRVILPLTIYRLTPSNYTGITNMDTADAHGDVMFGLAQLTLPQICPRNPDFTWCANEQYLSGGSANMVYTQFTLEADSRFGDYNACNPNNQTGIFECETWRNGTGVPRQCSSGYDIEHQDCLNGTLVAKVAINAPADSETATGACCDACTRAGAACGGWTLMPNPSSPSTSSSLPSSTSTSTCRVLKNDRHLREWEGAQALTGCKAAYVDPDAYACWYADPSLNTTFADVCDPTQCSCDAVVKKSVGRGQDAMCWDPQTQSSETFDVPNKVLVPSKIRGGPPKESRWIDYISGLGCLMNGTWYSTRAEGECSGPTVAGDCWWRLAEQHRTVNASCVDDRVVSTVRARRPTCWEGCPFPKNRTTSCYLDCLFQTLVGNASQGIDPMPREAIVAPFRESFLPVSKGGCPDA